MCIKSASIITTIPFIVFKIPTHMHMIWYTEIHIIEWYINEEYILNIQINIQQLKLKLEGLELSP